MRVFAILIILTLAFGSLVASRQAESVADGKVRQLADESLEAWDARDKAWVSLEMFWDRYAARRGGLTWGKRSDYPPYRQVSELDTMIIELDSGSCLMEFFHTRWRRANDVRRWDDAFNQYSACPHVFD